MSHPHEGPIERRITVRPTALPEADLGADAVGSPAPAADASPSPTTAAPEPAKVSIAPTRCPYCHDSVPTGETKVAFCAACRALHHQRCWHEHGACSTCGSERKLVPAPRHTSGPHRAATAPSRSLARLGVFCVVAASVTIGGVSAFRAARVEDRSRDLAAQLVELEVRRSAEGRAENRQLAADLDDERRLNTDLNARLKEVNAALRTARLLAAPAETEADRLGYLMGPLLAASDQLVAASLRGDQPADDGTRALWLEDARSREFAVNRRLAAPFTSDEFPVLRDAVGPDLIRAHGIYVLLGRAEDAARIEKVLHALGRSDVTTARSLILVRGTNAKPN